MSVSLQVGVEELDDPFEAELPAEPFPGLRPFEAHEWPIFFGRELAIDEVAKRLLKKHVIIVHGESGCGKSSLIRAGVLVQLQQSYAAEGRTFRTATMLPRGAPLAALSLALAKLDGAPENSPRHLAIHEAVNRGLEAPAAIAELVRKRGADGAPDPGDHGCILVDQFEELFRFARERRGDEAQRFVDIIVSLAREPVEGLFLVATMRSDFIGACARFDGLAKTLNETQHLLSAIARAITGTRWNGLVFFGLKSQRRS